jgi:hypothetical protein
MFPSTDAPRYRGGGIALAVFCVATAGAALTIKTVLKRENEKMRKLDEDEQPYTGSLEGVPKGYRFAT